MRSAWLGRLVLAAGLLLVSGVASAEAGTVAVRYQEGVTHGFLTLRSTAGDLLAEGDLLQVVRAEGVDSRLVFRFRDGSLHDETVVFSQEQGLHPVSYRAAARAELSRRDGDLGRARARPGPLQGSSRGARARGGDRDRRDRAAARHLQQACSSRSSRTCRRGQRRRCTCSPSRRSRRSPGELTPQAAETVLAGERRCRSRTTCSSRSSGCSVGQWPRSSADSARLSRLDRDRRSPAFVAIDGPLTPASHLALRDGEPAGPAAAAAGR